MESGRAAAFVTELLRELCRLSDEERLAPACQAAYRRTLAVHHPWLGRNAALLAMYALGTRGDTLLKLRTPSAGLGDDLGLAQCVDVLHTVHSQTEELFEEHQLTQLP
ncbi:glycolipid transfer protein domain-containing protein 2-like isoform X2 [Pollicipes pollicipes]|uniref:glycolipid transfer protein domain-containing protein 2-like isoform X2 n=1 Tax=Pollicipes pollicipes TaxID=41117 RepID=UPI00188582BA|nr:glycolipid transfer protein domain-containing protein 2-like isoform X2 [Pollicipes pollicipes]XP_037089109.1 glycolipid transfer protein domain-containing protein 2-like isoform X2 [Pollicipes pollicipes]